jgi:Na+/H+ antiporter NhaD/arsenite permease-like protein
MRWMIFLLAVCLTVAPMALATARASGPETDLVTAAGPTETGRSQPGYLIVAAAPPAGHGESSSHDATAANQGHGHANLGEVLPLWSCIPFAGMLLSIALFPLLAPDFWHHHFGKVSAFWAATLGIPFLLAFKGLALYEILHIILVDYIPFIILLWSLYTVSGGILLRGSLRGTPLINVVMLVFFIFLVANAGGSLTPLGDPPLFLGFLHGVSFFWTLKILPHMLTVAGVLLTVYFFLDLNAFRKEETSAPDDGVKEPLKLDGVHNFIFLAGIVGSVLMSGVVDWGHFQIFGIHMAYQDLARDGLLVAMGILSLVTTSIKVREDNDFTWFPILEVAYLFIGIFITMIPCLLILKAGLKGELAFLIQAVSRPAHYFWVTGALSSFLDNAPTYLTFFNTALGSFFAGASEAQAVPLLMTEKAIYLEAISAGAVFFGAVSYIGNAPNFMVRSIAEEAGTPMPSFFGYILRYSLLFLIPSFVIVTLIFF